MPNVFEIHEYRPYCNLILCGNAETGIVRLPYPQRELPALQALASGIEPSAGLPFFRLSRLPGMVPRVATGSTTELINSKPEALECPLEDADRQTLAEILLDIDWVTLIIGSSPESLSIALVIARYAKAQGKLVTALQSVPRPLPHLLRRALLEHVDLLCPIPAGLSVVDAAIALWSCVNTTSIIGVDFADFCSVRGMGAGQLL